MHQFFSVLGLIFASVLISSCGNSDIEGKLTNLLEKKPEILLNIIQKNPKKFMQVFQESAGIAQAAIKKEAAEKEKMALEQAFKNPFKPYIAKGQLIRGNKEAPITIIEYSDFECPFCARGTKTINALMKKYPGKIRYVFKHLPLSFHQNALLSAKYYEAISIQSPEKAFKFHGEVFKNQTKIKSGETYLRTVAKNLGVDLAKLNQDIKSAAIKVKIDEDKKEAAKFNFQGTPGYLLNGIPIKGAYPASYFEEIITSLQKRGNLVL